MKHEPGQVISGTLRLVKPVAEGGMGSVWIAEHLVLDRAVAVKRMSKQWAAVPNAHTRFLREAQLTARIENPHVVRVLDCRHDEADEPYIVLELLHGETLEERVRRHGALSVFEVLEIVEQTAEALGAAHDAGVVHRDVKPENVFLVAGASTFVKLIDFGVAKPKRVEECLDVDRLPAGTPRYMSPEHMFEPETTDERSDLFSLGAVAYFALTRRSPFEADSVEALYFAIEGAEFVRPSELRPELPAAVDRWFEKALARDRERRFESASEMAAALRDAIHAPANDTAEPPRAAADLDEAEIAKVLRGPPGRRSARTVTAIAAAVAATTLFVWHGATDVASARASADDPDDGGSIRAPEPRRPLPVVAPASKPAAARPRRTPSNRSAARAAATATAQAADDADAGFVENASAPIHEILDTLPNPDVEP